MQIEALAIVCRVYLGYASSSHTEMKHNNSRKMLLYFRYDKVYFRPRW